MKREVSVDTNKLLKIKPLVDNKTLQIGDVCKVLGVSYHLYKRLSKEIDDMNAAKKSE